MAQDKKRPEQTDPQGGERAREGAEIIDVRPIWSAEERALEQAWEDWVTTAAPPMKKSA